MYEELEYNHNKIKSFVIEHICEDCRQKLLAKLNDDEDEQQPVKP